MDVGGSPFAGSLGQAKHSLLQYIALLRGPEKKLIKDGLKQGFVGCFAQVVAWWIFAFAFWFAGHAVDREWCNFADVNIGMLSVTTLPLFLCCRLNVLEMKLAQCFTRLGRRDETPPSIAVSIMQRKL